MTADTAGTLHLQRLQGLLVQTHCIQQFFNLLVPPAPLWFLACAEFFSDSLLALFVAALLLLLRQYKPYKYILFVYYVLGKVSAGQGSSKHMSLVTCSENAVTNSR